MSNMPKNQHQWLFYMAIGAIAIAGFSFFTVQDLIKQVNADKIENIEDLADIKQKIDRIDTNVRIICIDRQAPCIIP